MRATITFVALLFVSTAALAQTPSKYQITHASGPCKQVLLNKHLVPLNSFHLNKGERYRHTPAVGYSIQLDGRVTDVKLVSSSGVKRLDDLILAAVGKWKYKPRATACGVLDTEMSLTIDWTTADD